MTIRVWKRAFTAKYEPFDGATERLTLAIPDEWKLEPEPFLGVILNTTTSAYPASGFCLPERAWPAGVLVVERVGLEPIAS